MSRSRARPLPVHRWTAALFALSVATSGAVSLLTLRVVHHSAAALVAEQSRLYAQAMTAEIGVLKNDLDSSAILAAAPGAGLGSFDGLTGNPDYHETFASLVLLQRGASGWAPVATAAPASVSLSDLTSAVGGALQGLGVGQFSTLGFLGQGAQRRLAIGDRPAAASQFLVYAEIPLAAAAGGGQRSGLPGGMNFALYVNGTESGANLAFATTGKLPLRGLRAVTVMSLSSGKVPTPVLGSQPGSVHGRATDVLMVVSPTGSPLGWLAGNLPWIFLLFGVAGAATISLGLELLLRRRDHRIALVEKLEANNAELDRALAERDAAESDRGRLEDQLRQAQRLEAVGQLAGGIAHDFNNLLAVILGNGDLALESLEGHPAHADVEEMLHAAQRAAALTRQLLVFSRKDIVRPATLDLNEVVATTTRLLQRTLGEHIDLRVSLGKALPHIEADVTGLEQVLMNLAVNARDAMPDGGVLTVSTGAVDLEASDAATHPGVGPGPYARLTVADTGVGMTAEVRAHAFEPFFTTKAVGAGTGMGLATIYAIVTRWGGHIDVESEPGKGVTFDIYLPAMAGEPVPADPVPEPVRLGSQQVVLLVEDEDGVRRSTRRMLERGGYRVVEATNGPDALRAYELGPVHLLLTDVIMPGGMSGKALVAELRDRQPDLPVLYVSGYTADVIATRGILDPDVALLEKPFTADALLAAVGDALSAPARLASW